MNPAVSGIQGMHIVRYPPNGPDRLEDLAQAWIDGKHEEVLRVVAAREAEIRARPVIVKRVRVKAQIVRLRKMGWRIVDIARQLKCHVVYAARCCRHLPRPIASTLRKERIRAMRMKGMTLKQIAGVVGVHYSTVSRELR